MSKRISIALVLVLASSSLYVAPQSMAARSRVKAAGSQSDGFRWEPASISIAKGDTIIWTNPTGKNHTVSSYSGSWSKSTQIGPGDTTRKRFKKAGTFKFRCLVRGHSTLSDGRCVGMCGQVVVR